jgi:predicted ABC-type exoprotein transport system permease subunit
MIEIFILIVMTVAAIRSAKSLRRDKALFQEFSAPETLLPFIYLFPLGPLALLVLPMFVGILPAALVALACYVPALYFLKPIRAVFERSGTDRTKGVQDALSIVFITGVGGVVYVIARTSIILLVHAGSGLR